MQSPVLNCYRKLSHFPKRSCKNLNSHYNGVISYGGIYTATGVHLYSSTDLYNWTDEGVVLKPMSSENDFRTEYFRNLYGALNDTEKSKLFTYPGKSITSFTRPKMLFDGNNYVSGSAR